MGLFHHERNPGAQSKGILTIICFAHVGFNWRQMELYQNMSFLKPKALRMSVS